MQGEILLNADLERAADTDNPRVTSSMKMRARCTGTPVSLNLREWLVFSASL
jgi:hypothetical protein